MAILWYLLGFISGCFFCGVVYAAHSHYIIRKDDFNGYEAHTVRKFMNGEI